MGDKTTIEWTEASWTPVRAKNTATGAVGWHCEHVSEGCRNCYAEALNRRLGTGLAFKPGHHPHNARIVLDEKILTEPLRWTRPRMVFVCSMTDLFGDWVTDEMLDRIFAVMALSPQHTFQVLTKRPERMRAYFAETWQPAPARDFEIAGELYRAPAGTHVADRWDQINNAISDLLDSDLFLADRFWTKDGALIGRPAWPRHPLPNVWLGVSVEDQAAADARIPVLLDTPAAIRWISAEPLLGPLDLRRALAIDWQCSNCHAFFSGRHKEACPECLYVGGWTGSHAFNGRHYPRGPIAPSQRGAGLDWIVVGGESGPGARPFLLDWARSIRDQCSAGGVAFFMKQVGAKPADDSSGSRKLLAFNSRKGGDPTEWPEDIRIRQWPERTAA